MARSNSASMVAVSFCRRPGITGVSSSAAAGGRMTGSGNGAGRRLRRRKRLARHRKRIEVGQIGPGQGGGAGPQGFILGVLRRRRGNWFRRGWTDPTDRVRSAAIGFGSPLALPQRLQWRLRRRSRLRWRSRSFGCGTLAWLHFCWLSRLRRRPCTAAHAARGRRDAAAASALRHPENSFRLMLRPIGLRRPALGNWSSPSTGVQSRWCRAR